jgi:CRP-like cAMP-binding protein
MLHRAPPSDLLELLPASLHPHCVSQFFPRGARLFETGRKPEYMYFVESGEVTLERCSLDGNTIILQRSRHGFVSEASLQSATYHCDAVAVIDTLAVRIPLRDLRQVLAGDPTFSMRWVGMLNQEIMRLRRQCERLSLLTVEERLLHLVGTEGSEGGYPLGSGLKSIARQLGVTHEALYRCIARLEKTGRVRRDAERLFLLKP